MDTGWSMQLGKIADAVLTMDKIGGFQTLQSHTIISAQCQIQIKLHRTGFLFDLFHVLDSLMQ